MRHHAIDDGFVIEPAFASYAQRRDKERKLAQRRVLHAIHALRQCLADQAAKNQSKTFLGVGRVTNPSYKN